MFHKEKYFKYKTKYLALKNNLQNHITNLEGGSYETGKKYFYNKLSNQYDYVLSILNADRFLKQQINANANFILPSSEEIKQIIIRDKLVKEENNKMMQEEKEKRIEEERKINEDSTLNQEQRREKLKELKQITQQRIQQQTKKTIQLTPQEIKLKKIFEYFESIIDSSNIDLFLKFYLTENGFGEPSSVENIGRFKDVLDLFKRAKVKKGDEIKSLLEFISLSELEIYIDQFRAELEESKTKKQAKRNKQLRIKEEGEDDVVVIMNLEKFIVYKPTSENGAKYYGRNTKWCTAAEHNNMFDYYNQQGPLFIVQSKTNPTDKYQLHFETEQYMDKEDKQVNMGDFLTHINDSSFDLFFYENKTSNIIELKTLKTNHKDKYDSICNFIKKVKIMKPYDTEEFDTDPNILRDLHNIEVLDIYCKKKDSVRDYLINIGDSTKIKKLTLDGYINVQFNGVFDNFINLEELIFNGGYNRPFENSLKNLTKLKKLLLKNGYNRSFNDSLSNLGNLEELYLGSDFNKPLGDSLNNLRKLQYIQFEKKFDKPLGNSLKELINLKKLHFIDNSEFNQPLNDSLKYLINLEELYLGYQFNESFENSLNDLTKLKIICAPSYYYHNNSFDHLINLEYLEIGNISFTNVSRNAFDNLVKLKKIRINTFNYFLGHPYNNFFDKVVNLKELHLGSFDCSIGNSFDKLVKLTHLNLPNFNRPIGNSFSKLVSLEELYLDRFNRPIGISFDKLVNLKILSLYKFNKPIATSFINLVNLTDLNLESLRFINPDTFKNLIKLKLLRLDINFEPLIGNSLNHIKNLNIEYVGYPYEGLQNEYSYSDDLELTNNNDERLVIVNPNPNWRL
jgi:hypothetical protein